MWVKIKNDKDCEKYLKNYTKRKVELVFEFLINSYDDYFIYKILKNYGHVFTKYQHLSLINRILEFDNMCFNCLENVNLNLEERILIFNKLINNESLWEAQIFQKIKDLIDSSFIFTENELMLLTYWSIKNQKYKILKLFYDKINLPKCLVNIIDPILVMEKLTKE